MLPGQQIDRPDEVVSDHRIVQRSQEDEERAALQAILHGRHDLSKIGRNGLRAERHCEFAARAEMSEPGSRLEKVVHSVRKTEKTEPVPLPLSSSAAEIARSKWVVVAALSSFANGSGNGRALRREVSIAI